MRFIETTSRVSASLSQRGAENESSALALSIVKCFAGIGAVRGFDWNKEVRIRRNYYDPSAKLQRFSPDDLSALLDVSISAEEIVARLEVISATNEKFFRRLRAEIFLSMAAYEGKRYEASFLHLYRAVEHLSVVLPFMYVQQEDRFEKGLEFLKGMIRKPRDGELAVLSSFMESGHPFSGLAGATITLAVEDDTPAVVSRVQNQFNTHLLKGELPTFDGVANHVDVPIEEFHHLIITARNLMFHYTHGGDNFDTGYCGGAAFICRCLGEAGLTWFALFYVRVLGKLVTR